MNTRNKQIQQTNTATKKLHPTLKLQWLFCKKINYFTSQRKSLMTFPNTNKLPQNYVGKK